VSADDGQVEKSRSRRRVTAVSETSRFPIVWFSPNEAGWSN
jgi:hypothetical protein